VNKKFIKRLFLKVNY